MGLNPGNIFFARIPQRGDYSRFKPPSGKILKRKIPGNLEIFERENPGAEKKKRLGPPFVGLPGNSPKWKPAFHKRRSQEKKSFLPPLFRNLKRERKLPRLIGNSNPRDLHTRRGNPGFSSPGFL